MRYSIRNPLRVASASVRGYWYQLLYSVSTWLELGDNEVLVVEGNEDVDRIVEGAQPETIEEQLKLRSRPLTSGAEEVKEAVLNFAEGFLQATRNGWRYRAVFRTNAPLRANKTTTIGQWTAGVAPSGEELHTALLKLARTFDKRATKQKATKLQTTMQKRPNDGAQLGRYELTIQELGVTGVRALAKSVTWKFLSGSLEDMNAKLLRQLATLVPTLDQDIVLDRLIALLFRKMSSQDLAVRMLRRSDLFLALNDVMLDALCQADSQTPPWSTLVLWYQSHEPAIAVGLYVEGESQAQRLLDREERKNALLPSAADPVLAALPNLDFVAYAAIRRQKGPRGARVCVREVIRQSEYRHTPNSLLLENEPETWLTAWISSRKNNPRATITVVDRALPWFAIARGIAGAVIGGKLDELERLGTKLRWVWLVDSGEYITAATIKELQT